MQFQKFTPKTKQLAKILSGGRSSQIVDLTQKLLERPTPKFYRRGASCAGANVSRTLRQPSCLTLPARTSWTIDLLRLEKECLFAWLRNVLLHS